MVQADPISTAACLPFLYCSSALFECTGKCVVALQGPYPPDTSHLWVCLMLLWKASLYSTQQERDAAAITESEAGGREERDSTASL